MARALRAGHAFPTGIQMVADEMPNPIGAEFKLLYDRQNFGMSLNDALKGMAERVPILDARFFTTAVLTQRETGGNLSEILDNLAAVIRDRFKVKRQVRAVTAHGRITGWILSGLPPVLALILTMVSPRFMAPMFTDPLGTKMIMAGLAMQVMGTLIIRKLVNIRY
jgi:tight adherence protein B